MPEYVARMMRPFPAQEAIIFDPTRFKVLCCGRRFSKTEIQIFDLAHGALRGERTAYFAPTYKMTRETWRQFHWRLGKCLSGWNMNEGRMDLVSGGSIDFWSLGQTSAETVRGRKYHRIAIDEAAKVVGLKQVFDEIIRPLLVDYKGKALFGSTPNGLDDFHLLYQMGLGGYKDWKSWHHPTVDNPYIDPAEVEQARTQTSERAFNQEYLAQFVENAGTVFRKVNEVCCQVPMSGPIVGHEYVGAIDWGRDIDFTVLNIFDITARRQVWFERFNEVGWAVQRGRVRGLDDHWRPNYWLAERNSIGEPNIEALQDEGLNVEPFDTTSRSKGPLIEALALAMERLEFTAIDDEYQKHELRGYTSGRTANGYIQYGAPHGGHDDCVMSLALAWWAAMAGVSSPIMRQGETTW